MNTYFKFGALFLLLFLFINTNQEIHAKSNVNNFKDAKKAFWTFNPNKIYDYLLAMVHSVTASISTGTGAPRLSNRSISIHLLLLNRHLLARPIATILTVKAGNMVALGGDGQVSFGDTIMKATANKIRRMYDGKILAGFAGSAADAFTLFELFEKKIEEFSGQLTRAAVELAKDWRRDKFLRHLEALLAVADRDHLFVITGKGDVVEPDDGIIAIGSGGNYALAAARALIANTDLDAAEVVRKSLEIASGICVYTNSNINVETLE